MAKVCLEQKHANFFWWQVTEDGLQGSFARSQMVGSPVLQNSFIVTGSHCSRPLKPAVNVILNSLRKAPVTELAGVVGNVRRDLFDSVLRLFHREFSILASRIYVGVWQPLTSYKCVDGRLQRFGSQFGVPQEVPRDVFEVEEPLVG